MNRKGERGSPCLNPLDAENVAEGEPFTIIEKKVIETKLPIHFTQSCLKLTAKRIAFRNL